MAEQVVLKEAVSLSYTLLLMLGGASELFTRKVRILFEEAWFRACVFQVSNKVSGREVDIEA